MIESIRLDAIAFNAGTQVRVAINEAVVAEYAERLKEGSEFPPIIVFHDGSHYFPADGFHRGMAHSRLGIDSISVDVRCGTREDALWFALGANRANGLRMTSGDKRHAILLAVSTWSERTQIEIAKQIGCTQGFVSQCVGGNTSGYGCISANTSVPDLRPSRVTRSNGTSYPTSIGNGSVNPKRAEVERLVRDGAQNSQILHELKISKELISDVRREMGRAPLDKSQSAVAERRSRMREMAEGRHTSIQIADEVGMTLLSCRQTLRDEGIAVPADRATSRAHRINSTRIVSHIVMDAENLTADIALIEFSALNEADLPGWIASLNASRDKLSAFIRRMTKELSQ